MSWEIKSKNNETRFIVEKVEYNDEWMRERYVTVSIESPYPIDFRVGDYLIYRGERFEINYDPGKIKSSPKFEKGDAFRYENVKFNSLADELTRCEFKDIVLNDNLLHFTGLPVFSFYGGVKDLADRIQANLDRAYGKGAWQVNLDPDFEDTTELNVSVDKIHIDGALEILVNDFKTYYTISDRVITIGAAGIPADHIFKYGKNNGLYELEENADTEQRIITRVRAYGSTRNIPHRYYNSLSGADGKLLIPDNMAVRYLMLPEFPYSTQDPYIDSENIKTLGVREGSIFFDGSDADLPEIYPSIEGMTAEDLKAAGVSCKSEGKLDVLIGAEQMTDNGVGKIEGDALEGNASTTAEPAKFKVTIKDVGFDINGHIIEGNPESPTLSFKTGMLGGRDFEIVECRKEGNNYILELNRVYDDDIKLWFPYKDYNAQPGDKFVLLYIKMPEVYIKAASQRLKEKATEWLGKNDYSRSVYAPKIDEIFIARQHDAAMVSGGKIKSLHDTLRAGMQLLFEDEDFGIDAAIFIDRLTIKEGDSSIPTYEVVLKEEKTVGRLDKIENKIDSLSAGQGQGNGGYTAAQIRALIDAYGGTRFLSKIHADSTPYNLGVGSLSVGDFVVGLSGAAIDRRGNAEVESITVRSFLKVYELIYNRLNALEGEFAFCDSATIESILPLSSNGMRLYMRKRWEGDFNAFQQGDIVYGYVNRLDNSGIHAKAWGNVTKVERSNGNYIEVTLYPDAEVDGEYNAPFTSGMIIARHGNSIEPNSSTASAYPQFIRESMANPETYINLRQSAFFISAPDGSIKYLHGVSAPKITSDNLGMVLGRIPEGLFPADTAIGQIAADGMPRVYAKGIITQEIIRTDYRGLPIRTQNYRGEWSARTAGSPTEYYTSNNELYDLVTYDGILYMCATPGTLHAPDPKNPDCGWIPVTDQRDVNVWSINSNVDVFIKKLSADGEEEILSPDTLSLSVILNSANGVIEIDDPVVLWYDYGLVIYEDTNNPDDVGDEDGFAVQDENGIKLTSESLWKTWDVGHDYNVNPLYYGDNKTFLLVDVASGKIVARKTIPVVSDGRNGMDGESGTRGPMAYPAGEYNPDTYYDSRSGISPVVLYAGQYFILKEGNYWEREQTTPATDDRWELVDKFNTVFTDILMANFAKLSSAVFYGDYMMSTQGTSSAGVQNNAYQNVDVYLDILEGKTKVKDGETPIYPFRPKYLLNLRTGQMWGDSLTAGNTVFGYEDVESAVGIYGSVNLNYDAITPNPKEFHKTGLPNGLNSANGYEDKTSGSLSLGGFSTSQQANVRVNLGGHIELRSYMDENSNRFATSVKATFKVLEETSNKELHSWEISIDDNVNKTKLEDNFTSHVVSLPKGTYYVRADYEIRFYALGGQVSADNGRGSAIVRFSAFGIEIDSQYCSMYGQNGFLLGNNANNYIMAIIDQKGGLNFTAENKSGYGLSLTSEGLRIKDGGAWQSLKDYIKENAK